MLKQNTARVGFNSVEIGLFYKLAKLDWHAAYQVAMSIGYIVLPVRLIQLILAFRGE